MDARPRFGRSERSRRSCSSPAAGKFLCPRSILPPGSNSEAARSCIYCTAKHQRGFEILQQMLPWKPCGASADAQTAGRRQRRGKIDPSSDAAGRSDASGQHIGYRPNGSRRFVVFITPSHSQRRLMVSLSAVTLAAPPCGFGIRVVQKLIETLGAGICYVRN